MYDGYNIVPIQSFSGMNTKKNGAERVVNREVLITNFDTQTNNLLYPQGGLYAIQQPLLKVGESPERTDSA